MNVISQKRSHKKQTHKKFSEAYKKRKINEKIMIIIIVYARKKLASNIELELMCVVCADTDISMNIQNINHRKEDETKRSHIASVFIKDNKKCRETENDSVVCCLSLYMNVFVNTR